MSANPQPTFKQAVSRPGRQLGEGPPSCGRETVDEDMANDLLTASTSETILISIMHANNEIGRSH